MDDAVEDSVGVSGFSDDGVPLFGWDLTCDDNGAFGVSVFDDLEKIDALGLAQGHHAPVVEDKELGVGDGF